MDSLHRGVLSLTVCAMTIAVVGCAGGAQSPDHRSGLQEAERRPSLESTATLPAGLVRAAPRATAVDPNERFDASRALAEAGSLTDFGVRAGGSEAEKAAADYLVARLRSFGYRPSVQTFVLPNGRTSRNVIASIDGYASARTLVLGAHIDTKPPSPGANDNASGVGVLLEIARLLADNPAAGRVELVFYGSEEVIDAARPNGHHFGSRAHLASLSEDEREDVAGMISVDMVGYGDRFYVQSMRRGPRTLVDRLLAHGRRQSTAVAFKPDLGSTGWSDHEAYELAGIPAGWLHWQDDPVYHTADDTTAHLQRRPIEVTGRFLLTAIRELGESDLEELCDR